MRRALLAALAVAAAAASAGALDVPFLAGRVNDEARLLDAGAATALEAKLKDYETRTGRQFAVLTIASLEGEPLEEFSLKAARTWKLGREDKDDGILLLVSRDDRRARIEVGYGLEGTLPDALAGRIVSDVMVPRFRGGDYAAGIAEGADAVIAALDRPSAPEPSKSGLRRGSAAYSWASLQGLLFLLVFGLLDLNEIRFEGGMDQHIYFFNALLLPLFAYSLSREYGIELAVGVFFLHLLGFPLAKRLMGVTNWGRAHLKKRSGPRADDPLYFGGGSASSGRGLSGGGFSGGGFSGGGGSFGGGGASGSW